jgi:hypothetical protein
VAPALAAGVTVALASAPAHAGGAIGWANAVTQFSTEGRAAAIILGIPLGGRRARAALSPRRVSDIGEANNWLLPEIRGAR